MDYQKAKSSQRRRKGNRKTNNLNKYKIFHDRKPIEDIYE